jgi:hypothetical protein
MKQVFIKPHRKPTTSLLQRPKINAVKETTDTYCENHTKHNYTLWAERRALVC